ncbi:NAD(P)/FAD-dependent oxidoreductase [Alteromonas sp. H39]|uniref:NAD(P)/FAD-dependent oxidoreductase n=1 Tax=Alteromonas sp. H39 TaxID=3389876 RepID=UPI0039E050F6
MPYDPLKSAGVTPDLPRPDSYWASMHTPASYAPLDANIHTRFAVIGAGYTGLSAALELAEAGQEVTVIDAHEIGFGCAGRNGGFVLKGTGRYTLNAIANKWGEQIALGMRDEFNDAVSLLTSRIQRYGIDCDLQPGPYLKIAHNQKSAIALQAAQEINRSKFASDETFVSASALQEHINIQHAFGGVIQPGLALNPLKLVDGYAKACHRLGVRIVTNTPVTNIANTGSGFELHTNSYKVCAERLVIASNAYTPKMFHPCVDKRQFPVQSSIIVTAPLSKAQRNATGLTRPMMMMDTRMMKYYYRMLPDGRLLFGGRGSVSAGVRGDASSRRRLEQAMVASFPALRDIKTDYFWNGWVSVSLDNLPRIMTDSNHKTGYAMGYCGSGVSFAALAGKRLAQRMLGESVDTRLPLYQDGLPIYPFAGMRRMALRALYAWAKLAE